MGAAEQDVTMGGILASVSSLYCLLLVAIYLVSAVRWLSTAPSTHYSEAEDSGLLLFLLAGSCLFLLYLLFRLSRHPHSRPGPASHGSAFLRNGALVFGLGSLTMYLLVSVELLSAPTCSSPLRQAVSLLAVLCIILQMVTVIFLPRLNLAIGWGAPHIGLMHLVATDIVLWIRNVLQESLHEFHDAQREEQGEGGRERREVALHPKGDHCDEGGAVTRVIAFLEPVLFAFTIEFVLIGATVFTNMWNAVGSEALGPEGAVARLPHIRETVKKMDWSHSVWGFLLGLLVFLLNIASLVIFFSIASKEHSTDEYAGKVIHSVTNCYGIGAVLLGLSSARWMPDRRQPEPAGMDRFLLNLGVFFVMVYTCFTVAVGVFPDPAASPEVNIPGSLHVVAGLLNLVQVSLQVVFVQLLLGKQVEAGTEGRPGRQAVVLLILLNLGLWLVDTFELQKSRASGAEEGYYGPVTWLAVQRVTLPICIFFRFHSAVLLTDCWKATYRPEEEGGSPDLQLKAQHKSSGSGGS